MWHNTEPDDQADSAGFADPLTDLAIALGIGCVIGAASVVLAPASGINVPGLWG